ncbi:MAG: hypothetical protein UH625_00590, partial [Muribaculaceae bacterium]|nr:hypothetical protein [Muribaculaceae bacterium]
IYVNPNAEQEFKMDEANELTTFTSNIYPGVDVIWGIAFDETLGNKVKISVLASGFDVTIRNENGKKLVYESDNVTKKNAGSAEDKSDEKPDTDRLVKEYGKDKIAERQRAADRMRYIVLTPEQMDDDRFLIALENSPAYNRDPKTAEEIRNSSFGRNKDNSDNQQRDRNNENSNIISFG